MSPDVVVIGGGPAGAAAAGFLAQAGLHVIVCEQKIFPRAKVCGEFLSAQSRPLLARLGVLAAFDAAAGPPVTRVLACPAQGPVAQARIPPVQGHYPRALPREQFDTMLLARAAALGATVLQPCHVSGIRRIDHGTQRRFGVATSHGPISARMVVLAHGLAQRGAMVDGPPPKRAPNAGYICFKAHYHSAPLPPATIAIAGARGVYAGLVETAAPGEAGSSGDRQFSLAFAVARGRLAARGNSADAQLAALLQENQNFSAVLEGARRSGPWCSSGPLLPGVRCVYDRGVFAVGNAAGEVHALVGEGMTLALASAAILADAVLGTRDALSHQDAVGAAYQRAWRKAFLPRYRAANVFTACMVRPGLANAAARLLRFFPPLMQACVNHSGKLHVLPAGA